MATAGGKRTGPAALARMVPLIDLRVLGDPPGEVDHFARNKQGLHVPVSSLSYQDQVDAFHAKRFRGW